MDIGFFPARIKRTRTPEAFEHMLRDLITIDLGAIDPYFFRAEISSDRTDAYHTHMSPSTLRNFAKDATDGISFLDSHDSKKLGFGQSLAGSYQENRVIADFYTVPGVNFGGQHSYHSTDDFIRAMQAGLVRDVSVGFYGGDMLCDICGNSFRDYANCSHWPGETYEVEEESVISTFAIESARLAEVSAVYEGATPGAMIMRANEMAQAGLLAPDMARRLETQYRIKLPTGQRVWPVKNQEKGETMEQIDKIAEKLESSYEQIAKIIQDGTPHHDDIVKGAQWLVDERTRLATLADDGRLYRSDLIEEAIAQGVRANGKDFTESAIATYRKMFATADITLIKQMSSDWKRVADAVFAGGRLTVDNEQQKSVPVPPPKVPDVAYKS